jgi:hypothetical protein
VRAVWSFWSKPYLASRKQVWLSEEQHLLSWILSLQTARKHFHQTTLYTDDLGARMLVDGLGLEFDTVSTELNALDTHDPSWWALGKILTYRLQRDAFIHIDNDVYLWKPLPLTSDTPLFAQNPEGFVVGASFYMPEHFESAVKKQSEGWMPEEWQWYRKSGKFQRAESCGIFGGCRTDFVSHYASLALRIVEHPGNQSAWQSLSSKVERNILIEQYFLSACIEFHRSRPDSLYHGINIQYLFDNVDDTLNPRKAAEAGYTHLIAGAKRNRAAAVNLEKRVQKDYPEAYQRYRENKRHLVGIKAILAKPRAPAVKRGTHFSS